MNPAKEACPGQLRDDHPEDLLEELATRANACEAAVTAL